MTRMKGAAVDGLIGMKFLTSFDIVIRLWQGSIEVE